MARPIWEKETNLDEKFKHLWLENKDGTFLLGQRGYIRMDIKEGEVLSKYCSLATERVVEIGRRFGGSTWLISESTNVPVISIDLTASKLLPFVDKYVESGQLTLINENSKNVKIDYKYDILFVDGDHHYNGVKSDIINFWDNLTTAGYAIFHDYIKDTTEVARAVDELLIDTKRGNVVEHIKSILVIQKIK
tara:strand:+ start:72 stop:647 length:576 start_codon:yes stop_codon:yes gene_type:complete